MKRKKVRMYKAWFIFIIFFVLFFSVPYIYINFFNKDEPVKSKDMVLKEIGYSLNDIKSIMSDAEVLEYALDNDYDELLISYMSVEGFDVAKVKKYYDYSSSNDEAPISDVVAIVNKDIDSDYSQFLMGVINDDYFIDDKIDDYLLHKDDYPSARRVVEAVNSNITDDFYTNLKASNLNSRFSILVNKYYYLEDDFEGFDIVSVDPTHGNGFMNVEAYKAFINMRDAASKEGLNLFARSNYRSYATQEGLYNRYKNNNGVLWADSFSARPGHSEHQTGLAIDVTSGYSDLNSFVYSNEFVWMSEHASEFGFILRYPDGYKYITGYDYEPWHYRYVGVDTAKVIKEKNLIFEEYYAYYVLEKGTND